MFFSAMRALCGCPTLYYKATALEMNVVFPAVLTVALEKVCLKTHTDLGKEKALSGLLLIFTEMVERYW